MAVSLGTADVRGADSWSVWRSIGDHCTCSGRADSGNINEGVGDQAFTIADNTFLDTDEIFVLPTNAFTTSRPGCRIVINYPRCSGAVFDSSAAQASIQGEPHDLQRSHS